MSQATVSVKIPFEYLVDAISVLSIEDKQKLWQILSSQLHPTQEEEDIYDWGIEGQPATKPVKYIPEKGLIVIGGKNDPN
jgi:hypothetical protein